MDRPEPECLMELRHGEANTEQQQEAYRILGEFAEYMAKLEAENLQWVRESEIAQARIAECDAEIARLREALEDIASSGCCETPACSIETPLCHPMIARAALEANDD